MTEIIATVLDNPNKFHKDNTTVQSRANIPKGYKRVDYAKGSFEDYLRNYCLLNSTFTG